MLKNLKVIELASVFAGPAVGMFFAELGARVIKIENPASGGDMTRKWKLASENPLKKTSAYFASVNYGKEYMWLNLHEEKNLEVLYTMIKEADVLICNWKKGDAEKFKTDYHTLKKINPSLIYGAISGYDETSGRVAYDVVLQAETGWMSMNGTPHSGAVKIPVAIIDLFAAHQLKEGILVALLNRTQSGEGAKVTVSLFDAAIASLANQASNFLMEKYIPQRTGSLHPNIAPYGETLHTKDDKQIILAVGTDKQFNALCEVLSIEETENLFSTNQLRVQNRTTLAQLLQEKIQHYTAEEILSLFQEKNIPAGLIRNLEEVFALPAAKKLILTNDTGSRVQSVIFKIEN